MKIKFPLILRLSLMVVLFCALCTPSNAAYILFSDTFTEGSDTSLATHAPDTGDSWALVTSVGGGTLKVKASSDEVQPENGGASDGALYTAELGAAYPSANYEISVIQGNGDTGDDVNILAVRVQDADNMYAVRWNESAGQIYENTGGTWATLGTATAGVADGSVVTLRAVNNTITFLDDGVALRSVNDSTITAAGEAGIGMGSVILADDDLAQQNFDDVQVALVRRLISVT